MRIAAVIPTLNEEAHIGALLSELLGEACPELETILVVDGGSSDRTCEIVSAIASKHKRVRLLDNPDRVQSAGCNLAAREAGSEIDTLIRLDAHAGYPGGYISRVAAALQQSTADSVVVRLRTEGRTCFQIAVASMSNSRLGTGGSIHRVGGASGWVDHGHHAGFQRSSFLGIGGYDGRFQANEDAEFDVRLRRAGGRIWFASDVEVIYYPRASVRKLARQYFRYGRGRARTGLKTGERPRPRQLAAPALVGILLASAAVAPLSLWSLLFPAAYVAALVVVSSIGALTGKSACFLFCGPALATMHLCWGAGYWTEMVVQLFIPSTRVRSDQ